MIVHELGTNALKYGALSAPEGQVFIEGKIDRLNGDGKFSFAWKEIGGPPLSAIEAAAKHEGSATLHQLRSNSI
ncbi:MAG: sensor histidine kinase [Rhizobiales bacterium]|nr:sensor histidine kinase [Hyphomicrobiales bacterium]